MRQTRPLTVQARPPACKPEGSIRQSFQDSLVLDHLNLAKSIAARYSAHTHDLDDVRQVAYMGLIKASRGYDESKGVSFPAYAAPTIAGGEVKRYLRDHCWVVRPPRTIQDVRRQVLARTEEMTQTLQRTPSPEEVAEDLSLESCQVREALMAGTSKRPDSLDAPASEGGRDGSKARFLLSVARRTGSRTCWPCAMPSVI